jgi:2'-5' RNA ligase
VAGARHADPDRVGLVVALMRLFVAVQLPPDIVRCLARLRRRQRPGVRWTTAAQWHVTLRFLGDVDDPGPVVEALTAADLEPAEARLGPAVEALGRYVVAVPVTGLDDLARRVVAATDALGAPPPDRPYRGHVTLARVKHGDPKALAGEPVEARWPVEEIRLVRSRLGRDSARYEDLHVRSLVGPRGGGPPAVIRVLVVGPTSRSWGEIAGDVEVDLVRLRRAGVEVSYRCTGDGPASIRTEADVIAAAPHVVRTVIEAARDGFDAVIVDCTDDPGVTEARDAVPIPVVGAGEALRDAVAAAPGPVRTFSGDELRTLSPAVLVDESRDASTVALGGTGHSHLAPLFTVPVIDPLDAALARCLGEVQ